MKKLILSVAFLGLGVFGFAQTTDRKADFEQKKSRKTPKDETRAESY